MADNFSIQAKVQLLESTTAEVDKTYTCTGLCTETFMSTVSLGAAATGISVALAGLTTPKMIVLYGDKGVGMRMALEDTLIVANRVAVISDTDGFTQASVYLFNSDSQAHSAVLYAAE